MTKQTTLGGAQIDTKRKLRWSLGGLAALTLVGVLGSRIPGNPPLSFQPGSTAIAEEAAAATGVPGTYVASGNGQRGEIVLHADGRATFNGQAGQWQANGQGSIVLTDGQDQLEARVEASGLTIQTPEGAVAFTRQISLTGSIDGRLVGCWHVFAGSGRGGTGSHMSETTLTLAGDGTYQYRSYSSVSVPSVPGVSLDSSGVSDEREQGSWRAQGTTVSFVSSSGQGSQNHFRREGGMLHIGQRRYLRCT